MSAKAGFAFPGRPKAPVDVERILTQPRTESDEIGRNAIGRARPPVSTS